MGKLSSGELGKILEAEAKKRSKEHEELKATAKPLYDLVKITTFSVLEVFCQSHSYQVSPSSEAVIGRECQSYPAGMSSELALKVEPSNKTCPVKEISFSGFSAVRSGDLIIASIPTFEVHKDFLAKNSRACLFHCPKPELYVDRPYHEQESAIEIAIVGSDKILRTDRSTDYKKFQRPSSG